MKKSLKLRVFATTLLLLLATCTLASAQATRTWVSGVGDDANPCSRTAPCKTFAGAISKTAVGGEIDVLDPGGFGALTITKSISIEADGVIAGVLVSGTNGFVVNAGPSDVVMIRGLTFEGLGTGLSGISVLQAGAVYVENCQINDFTNFGIDFKPGTAGSALFVTNTTVRHNGVVGTGAGGGIFVEPTPISAVSATLTNVRMEGNIFGLKVVDGGEVMVKDSVASGNKFAGFTVASTGSAANLFLDHSVASSNGTVGAQATGNANATLRLANSSFTSNATGISAGGGTVASFGTNSSSGNTTADTSGTITPVPLH